MSAGQERYRNLWRWPLPISPNGRFSMGITLPYSIEARRCDGKQKILSLSDCFMITATRIIEPESDALPSFLKMRPGPPTQQQ